MSTRTWSAWSCTVRLVVEDDRVLDAAAADLQSLLAQVDAAASRFRPDSALSIANARAGRPTPVPKLLVDLVDAALRAAADTDGAVDPTLGRAMHRIGYDRDIAELTATAVSTVARRDPQASAPKRNRSWRGVRLHREAGLLTVPAGMALDLGATAKAWTADHAANTLASRYGTATLVELGGDLAVGGSRREGWCVQIAEREGGLGQRVLLRGGGMATSTTTVRTWQQDGRSVHHLIDPRTGEPADGPWRTVTVAASSAYAANVASTAAIVLGSAALPWLTERRLAARLVALDDRVVTTPGWPAEDIVDRAGAA